HHLAHVDHSCLRGGVGEPARPAVDARGGGDVDDEVKLVSPVQQVLHQGERTIQVDRHGALEVVELNLLKGHRVGVAGVVHQQVDVTDLIVDPTDRQLQRRSVAHVDRRSDDQLAVRVVSAQLLDVPSEVL